jgi:hypothetical protein
VFVGSEGEDGDSIAVVVSSTTADGMVEMLDLGVKKLVTRGWGGEKDREKKIKKLSHEICVTLRYTYGGETMHFS